MVLSEVNLLIGFEITPAELQLVEHILCCELANPKHAHGGSRMYEQAWSKAWTCCINMDGIQDTIEAKFWWLIQSRIASNIEIPRRWKEHMFRKMVVQQADIVKKAIAKDPDAYTTVPTPRKSRVH